MGLENRGVSQARDANLLQKCLAVLLCGLYRVMAWTWRIELEDESLFYKQPPNYPVIAALWHNRLGIAMVCRWKVVNRHPLQRPMAALVSASRDGAFLSEVLKWSRMHAARGSSSRRGARALLELARLSRQGYDIAVTPDGPRGPCYRIQTGVMTLAQITGAPIYAVSAHYERKWILRSWDRFQIPKPFSKVRIHIGKPIFVPRELSPDELDRLQEEVSRGMNYLRDDKEEAAGSAG